MTDFKIHHGNALDVLKTMGANSVDGVVTDPPYELGFMGKAWDSTGIAYDVELWRQVLRVLKPGGHLLAFGGTRTCHRMVVAIEDAGFQIRDQLQWIYGSGFPKSLDVSKAIDKEAGAEREVVGRRTDRAATPKLDIRGGKLIGENRPQIDLSAITAPATDAAKQWEGFGTALKPANEPICLARKPLEKGLTVAANVLKWGTGALNIDGCRIPTVDNRDRIGSGAKGNVYGSSGVYDSLSHINGRFPANVIHDGSDEVEAEFAKYGQSSGRPAKSTMEGNPSGSGKQGMFVGSLATTGFIDSGSASRFFYVAKSSRSERNRNLDGMPVKDVGMMQDDAYEWKGTAEHAPHKTPPAANHHPTVKPVALMSYLCRLITPPGGTVLDPFNGSGSTGIAALGEKFNYIGIELNSEYIEISNRRLSEIVVSLF